MKECRKCKVTKEVSEFYPARRNKDGLQSYCKKCVYLSQDPDQREQRRQTWKRNNPAAHFLVGPRRRAKLAGIQFDLVPSDITFPSHCPVLGIVRVHGVGRGRTPRDDWYSLDRIDNEKGYTKDNTIIVSWRANRLKSDATKEELRLLADFYKDK